MLVRLVRGSRLASSLRRTFLLSCVTRRTSLSPAAWGAAFTAFTRAEPAGTERAASRPLPELGGTLCTRLALYFLTSASAT